MPPAISKLHLFELNGGGVARLGLPVLLTTKCQNYMASNICL